MKLPTIRLPDGSTVPWPDCRFPKRLAVVRAAEQFTPVIPDVTTRRLCDDLASFGFCVWRTTEDGEIERLPPNEFAAPE